ncbi:hypothetical protein BDK51DRAFT_41292 [Blyttiomyces helicus]|uniref:Uncharacterized protein n=1 Tax=Blyttiomyces helicus TaxID=388810 RepID=A0A4P9WC70_9FUNG|nr:hypothetical protein BDK51DRAFT_41292 [Blyttiomyces helicus]|eukprot:RKO90094.1 hypothetical protein BDK51DRAFT_41292 [Blyttiomyces helicus]
MDHPPLLMLTISNPHGPILPHPLRQCGGSRSNELRYKSAFPALPGLSDPEHNMMAIASLKRPWHAIAANDPVNLEDLAKAAEELNLVQRAKVTSHCSPPTVFSCAPVFSTSPYILEWVKLATECDELWAFIRLGRVNSASDMACAARIPEREINARYGRLVFGGAHISTLTTSPLSSSSPPLLIFPVYGQSDDDLTDLKNDFNLKFTNLKNEIIHVNQRICEVVKVQTLILGSLPAGPDARQIVQAELDKFHIRFYNTSLADNDESLALPKTVPGLMGTAKVQRLLGQSQPLRAISNIAVIGTRYGKFPKSRHAVATLSVADLGELLFSYNELLGLEEDMSTEDQKNRRAALDRVLLKLFWGSQALPALKTAGQKCLSADDSPLRSSSPIALSLQVFHR